MFVFNRSPRLVAPLGLLAAASFIVTSCSTRDFSDDGDAPEKTPSTIKADSRFARNECDVIIAGGSTAALAAAISATQHGSLIGIKPGSPANGARQHVCLVEPTDWLGGQLTSSMVSAIDFSHQKDGKGRDVGLSHNAAVNNATLFHRWINNVGAPTAKCWVTNSGCFEPVNMLRNNINPTIANLEKENLTVFRNAVVKRVGLTGRNVTSVTIVERKSKSGSGYERPFSEDVLDWYSETDSANFSKTVTRLTGRGGRVPVVIDATELGDVLVLSGASYLQGVEEINSSKMDGKPLNESGAIPYVVDKHGQSRVGNRAPWGTKKAVEACAGAGECRGYDEAGQMIVYPFIARLNGAAVPDNSPQGIKPSAESQKTYTLKDTWDRIWRYRRIKGTGAAASTGDLSLQNYNPGNDYPFGYMLLGMEETEAQKSDWKGGLNVETLRGAEAHSIGWFRYLRSNAPGAFKGRVDLDKAGAGTGHGLAKMPYVRDTRRSVGVGDFVIKYRHIVEVSGNGVTAHPFTDAIAIGSYVVDIHPPAFAWKPMPVTDYLGASNTIPYFLPLRALTNRDVDNLLVAGKTMAQTFHANAAIRLQPEEWNTGAAAGVAAAYMLNTQQSSKAIVTSASQVKAVRDALKRGSTVYSPVRWTILAGGRAEVYP